MIAILLRGPTAITLMGREVRLYPPGNPATIAYALLFFWGVSLWRRHRAALDVALGVPGRTMFYWHAVPVAIYFLLPQRLLAFLWFVGPYNNPGAGANPLNGAVAYWMGFAEGFHVSTWMAALVIVLVLVGAARAGRLPPGARAAFMLALLSFLAVIIHPQHQSRFLASWIFAVWVVAGFGAAVIAGWLAEAMGKPMRIVSASAIVAGVIAANALTTPSAAAYRHAIRPTEGATDIDLIRPYIQELDGVGSVMFVTTFGSSDLFRWVLHERCRCKMPVTSPWILGLTTREAVRQLMTQRVAETGADRIVVIDAPRSRYQLGALGWTYEVMVGAVDAMQQQTRFERIASHDLPDHGARVSIWRRRD